MGVTVAGSPSEPWEEARAGVWPLGCSEQVVRVLQVFAEASRGVARPARGNCSSRFPGVPLPSGQRAGVSSLSPALLRPGREAVGTPLPFQGPARLAKATSHLREAPWLVQGHTARRAGPVVTDQVFQASGCSPESPPQPSADRKQAGRRGRCRTVPSPVGVRPAGSRPRPGPRRLGLARSTGRPGSAAAVQVPGRPPPGFGGARQPPGWRASAGRWRGGVRFSRFLFQLDGRL